MAKLETLTDSFGGIGIDGSKWTDVSYGGGSVTEAGGFLSCAVAILSAGSAGQINSINNFDLTASYGLINAPLVTSQNAYSTLDLVKDGSNKLSWFVQGGNITAQYTVAGSSTTVYNAAYNSSTHAWWRIRESGGTIFWDTSTDGLNWTNRGSVATPITITALQVQIYAYDGNSDAAPGTAHYDSFNIAPASASTGNQGYMNLPGMGFFG